MKTHRTPLLLILTITLLVQPHSSLASDCTAPLHQCWQRVTAHINGVFSPRGYFNLLVGLYSLSQLDRAQFNLSTSTIVMDFPPGSPVITAAVIQTIEKRGGYRPGGVTIQQIAPADLRETGPGWMTIKHPQSKNLFLHWAQQNF